MLKTIILQVCCDKANYLTMFGLGTAKTLETALESAHSFMHATTPFLYYGILVASCAYNVIKAYKAAKDKPK